MPQTMRTSFKSFLFGKSRLLQFKSHFAVLPECRSCPGISPQRCYARSRQRGHCTVISHSDGHSVFKVQLEFICRDRKFDLCAEKIIKSRHISTLIIGESFALASNQMLICDGFESFKRPYCLRRLNSTLNSTKTTVASHGTLRKENTAGIADWCLTIPLRRHHIQLYTS